MLHLADRELALRALALGRVQLELLVRRLGHSGEDQCSDHRKHKIVFMVVWGMSLGKALLSGLLGVY